ncbi:SDR family oxidoreductase [Rhodoferax sp.]|uniref:SDR family NAD(P)-dependent oxidoreductase n=1 Tax=Rhodoferax sp. TaxID=50421 RepID=UPI001ED2D4F5|nr:SDR family oxidoreductase [Rhodoferax sp.]MBT9508000.1 SDR family oxidoreductase [Rhodoferax sp.]
MNTPSNVQDPRRQLFAASLGLAPGLGRLKGRNILILGAGQRAPADGAAADAVGNGRAMSLLFAREGAHVACADVDLPAAQETVRQVRAAGGTAVALAADAADPQFAQVLFRQAAQAIGPISGAVANVGIANGRNLANESADTWDLVMAVNVRAHMLLAQQGIKDMIDGSALLLISSLASSSPVGRNPAYETSKAALAALCRAAALEGQPRGIRVNGIAPGLLDTPMGRAASVRSPSRAVRPLPFGRQGTAWELAHTALFLIGDEASYVNAQMLYMDGGLGSSIGLAPQAVAA